jgi:hypothetical protein
VPLYEFFNETTGESVDVFFHMTDEKVYNGEDGTEIGQWRRVYHAPLAAIDTKLDPRDKNAFVRRTEKYTKLGEMQDISREMSEKRAAKDGKDPVREKWLDNYEKSRNGKKHFERIPKVVETPHIKIDMSN